MQSGSSTSPSETLASSYNRSTARVLDMLDLFLAGDAALTLTEVCERLHVPKSTAHGVLHTLSQRGYVTSDPATKAYSIGMRLVALANAAPIIQILQSRARPHLELLAQDLRETALLNVFEGDYVVAIDLVESSRSLRYFVKLGRRWPLHATSAGKLFLAELTDEAVRLRYSRVELERVTGGTIVGVDALVAELAEVRRQGWARQREEIIDDVSGFGAPLKGPSGKLVGTLTVTGPTERILANSGAIVARLVDEASALSAELAAPG
jgi:IclR family acetate operon transcriptional repressor